MVEKPNTLKEDVGWETRENPEKERRWCWLQNTKPRKEMWVAARKPLKPDVASETNVGRNFQNPTMKCWLPSPKVLKEQMAETNPRP